MPRWRGPCLAPDVQKLVRYEELGIAPDASTEDIRLKHLPARSTVNELTLNSTPWPILTVRFSSWCRYLEIAEDVEDAPLESRQAWEL